MASMSKGQALNFFALLRGLGITPSPHGWALRPTPEQTEKLALELAAGARKALGAGAPDEEIREGLALFFAAEGGEHR